MRKLMWFTMGFALGCALCITVCWQQNLLPLLLYAVVSGILCLTFHHWNVLFRFPAAVFLGLTISIGWFQVLRIGYLDPIQPLDGTTVPLRFTAVDYSVETEYGLAVDGFAVLEGKPYRLHVYQSGEEKLTPGDVAEGNFYLRLTTPGGKKDSSYYQGSGVFLLATQRGEWELSHSRRSEGFFLPARIARNAKDRIRSCFPEDTAAFAKALFLGDTSDLGYEVDTALKISGIRHVVAVSGLHVSILFGLVFLVLRGNPWLRLFVSVPVLVFFAAVTGFSPSVTRACLMCGLMAFGAAVRGEYDGLTSLSFAALCMLTVNPFVLLSVSFQLSVASVAGILLFATPVANRLQSLLGGGKQKGIRKKMAFWLSSSLSVSVSAMVFSVPLSAYYFGTVSLVGILTNLLTIWLMPFLFCAIAAVSLFAGLMPTFCHILGWVTAWPIRYVLTLARLFSRIPFAAVYTKSGYVIAWLVSCYLLLVLFLLSGRKRGKLYFGIGAACLVCALAASVWIPKQDAFRLNVLDVGEGQAILLQAGNENFLIDCGGSNAAKTADMVAQTLLSQGVFRLDGLALTHYDRDHTNGLHNLLTRIPVGRFYLPHEEGQQMAARLMEVDADTVTLVDRDTELPFGTGTITLFEPGKSKADNENCMCVLFESQECVILITGDRSRTGELALLDRCDLPLVDVLIAGHHGSGKSTSQELLETVLPRTVVISVGPNNYGHPAQALLERLEDFGCSVYRTDLHGSVLIRR